MTTRFLLAILLVGCGDDPVSTCTDPKYGDGTCDPQLACDEPDIDCFQTFASDDDAATWWMTTGGPLIGESFPAVATSDPRFAPMRALLDQGWDAFKQHRPVGELASARPALVIVDKPQLQNAAFVEGGDNVQPFVVMVETPALALGVDNTAVLGVMMHELQHAVGLHKLGDNADRLRAFYTAPAGSEPLGREQTDDPNVHQVGEAWRAGASQIGPYSDPQLGGFPMGGYFQTMLAEVDASVATSAQCTTPVHDLQTIGSQLVAALDPLDSSLPRLSANDGNAIASAFAALRDTCLAGQTFGVIDVGAALANITPAEYAAQLDAHDLALVQGKPFVDGFVAIVEDRRTAMRDAESAFTSSTAQPFAELRFFSYEEDADDVSEIVMKAAGFDPTSESRFLLALLPAGVQSTCTNETFPGYGVDLTDEHHATCWRIAHQKREAAQQPSVASHPVAVRKPGALPHSPSPSDRIAD